MRGFSRVRSFVEFAGERADPDQQRADDQIDDDEPLPAVAFVQFRDRAGTGHPTWVVHHLDLLALLPDRRTTREHRAGAARRTVELVVVHGLDDAATVTRSQLTGLHVTVHADHGAGRSDTPRLQDPAFEPEADRVQ